MNLDNTAFTMYMKCGKMYYERYEADANEVLKLRNDNLHRNLPGPVPGLPILTSCGIEPIEKKRDGLAFGSCFHALADTGRRLRLHPENVSDIRLRLARATSNVEPAIRVECESVYAQYEQHYLGNDYTYLESERTHTIPIPETQHSLVVKIDAVARFDDWTIGPVDTKTEEKPGYNFREDWAGRTQASLYLWALAKLYPEERVSRLVVDVVTRGNSRRAPAFNRIDDISRTPEELADAIRNFTWACDDIERSRASGWWRSNMNICKDSWKRCDYYDLHVYGRTPENLRKFQPAEAYLEL